MLQKLIKKKFWVANESSPTWGHLWSASQKGTSRLDLESPFFYFEF
ncbi:hypothetical protein E2C01_070116 [Portunus trituberculatus]|uniref:Uncharacterized protein n=1 Tax=Portunus trituberculatus TaxID=210409 RepID=A0A5B7HWF1_PORTR|nr:hypothetical protein [Portunus trituberculatus]